MKNLKLKEWLNEGLFQSYAEKAGRAKNAALTARSEVKKHLPGTKPHNTHAAVYHKSVADYHHHMSMHHGRVDASEEGKKPANVAKKGKAIAFHKSLADLHGNKAIRFSKSQQPK